MATLFKPVSTFSYSELVAYVGQENAPPGTLDTIGFWISRARIGAASVVLDLACNTAYSARMVTRRRGCATFGLDISPCVIARARAKSRAARLPIQFLTANAERLPLVDASMTHILAGCVFGFFGKPRRALDESARVLRPGGYLCTATFYYSRTPPESVLDGVAQAAGFRPRPSWTRSYWDGFFGKRFRLVSAQDAALRVQPERTVARNCQVSIARAPALRDAPERVRAAALQQLLFCRLVFNEHRRYQRYSVQVWQR